MNYKKYRNGEYMSGINITPFTDIILVLLIIFMIAAPGLLNTGIDIVLPGAQSSSSYGENKLHVGLDREGHLYLNGSQISREELKNKISAHLQEKDADIVLNADVQSQHGIVVETLDLIKATGARKIFVGVIPR
ncbi:MAG: biopolymer transporter ExbD [Spirochaetia bacterium]|nr:biopolymer transporter ExbD [Spirochaetia bacterium]